MGVSPLRQFLRSLCHNSYWNYAVFWKIQHHSQMLLTWEDGYCDCSKLSKSTLVGNCLTELDKIISSSCDSSSHVDNLCEYLSGLAMVDMSRVQNALGEGLVHEELYTRCHCWFSCDNTAAGDFSAYLLPEFRDEMLLQFAAGIKTILLVSVVPHGVLQLGSLQMIAEDLELVAYIKDEFSAQQNLLLYSVKPSSSLMFAPVDDPLAIITNKMHSEHRNVVDGVKQKNKKLSTTNEMVLQCTGQDACGISSKDVHEILSSAKVCDIGIQPMAIKELLKPPNQSLNDIKSDTMGGCMFRFSSLERQPLAISSSNYYDVGLFGDNGHATINSFSEQGKVEEPLLDNDAYNTSHKNVSSFFSFPRDSELHKVLVPAFLGKPKDYLWDSSRSVEDTQPRSSLIQSGDSIHGIDSSAWESSGCLADGDNVEDLLEGVLTTVSCSLNDNSFNIPDTIGSSMSSLGQFATSFKGERNDMIGEGAFPWGHATPAFVSTGGNAVANSLPPNSSFESMMSTLIEEQQQQQQQKKGYNCLQSGKGSQLSNIKKRRAGPGDNRRPRPRDRQLIQDRVKELRELVPDGAKCSIDGLLDRAIKHMMFLKSATDQADKLRHWACQLVIGQENVKISGTKTGHHSGTSWAVELGSELQICPIVVEDLDYPGHMLIEMLCNDHGLFLEIAEVIRRLQLTILKGVMENRSDNMWAHFIVEASKGFHRLDIFWPLMQLLRQNQCPISSNI